MGLEKVLRTDEILGMLSTPRVSSEDLSYDHSQDPSPLVNYKPTLSPSGPNPQIEPSASKI